MDKSLEPSLEQVRAIATSGSYRCVPVKRELMADRITAEEYQELVELMGGGGNE